MTSTDFPSPSAFNVGVFIMITVMYDYYNVTDNISINTNT